MHLLVGHGYVVLQEKKSQAGMSEARQHIPSTCASLSTRKVPDFVDHTLYNHVAA